MEEQRRFPMSLAEVASAAFIVIGVCLLLFVPAAVGDMNFAQPYYEGARGVGRLLLVSGLVWLALAEMNIRLGFFDTETPFKRSQAAWAFGVAALLCLLAFGFALNALPPSDATQATAETLAAMRMSREQARALRQFIALALALMSVALFLFPILKASKKR